MNVHGKVLFFTLGLRFPVCPLRRLPKKLWVYDLDLFPQGPGDNHEGSQLGGAAGLPLEGKPRRGEGLALICHWIQSESMTPNV